jgi:hypothetical protein
VAIRDSQRSKLYKAEDAAFRRAGEPTLDFGQTVDFIRKVEGSAIWRKILDEGPRQREWRPLIIEAGKSNWSACAHGTFRVIIPTWARKEWVILHELAHIAVTRTYTDANAAPHGWQFASVYLRLVKHFLGKAAHDKLRDEFRSAKVRSREPIKRAPLSEERKAQLREQLAVARAAKQH